MLIFRMRYIQNEYQKLDIYKRIAGIESEEERDDMLEELMDRFGEPPRSVQNLLSIANLKAIAHRCYFTEVAQKGDFIRFTMFEHAIADPVKIEELGETRQGKAQIHHRYESLFPLQQAQKERKR